MSRTRLLITPILLVTAVTAIAFALRLGGGSSAQAGTTTITVGDTWFCNSSFQGGVCVTTVSAGDTVVWDFNSALLSHSSTECGASCDMPSMTPLWDSGIRYAGGTFEQQFNTPGSFLYRCVVHPTEMRGRIDVTGGVPATATPTRSPTPRATPAATPPRRAGDADCSGDVGSIDAALILQRTARLIPVVLCEDNADVDLNGRIDSIDAALVLQHVAGLIEEL